MIVFCYNMHPQMLFLGNKRHKLDKPTWKMRFRTIKTHHNIICFVRPLHSKPGMERYCCSSTDQLSRYAYGAIISQV